MTPFTKVLALSLSLVLCGCQSERQAEQKATQTADDDPTVAPIASELIPGHDYHSYANPDAIAVQHLYLDLDVDFAQRTLAGSANLKLDRSPTANTLQLDTRDLTIESVSSPNHGPLTWRLGPSDEHLGAALIVDLPGGVDQIAVVYRTDPGASGLQWLTPAQTTGEHPFLFTQSQAIHARSWVPIQDTPQVRFTYAATIRTQPGLRAVMSAQNDPQAAENGVFTFDMPQAIPSYLLALAVGDLDFAAMSARTGVYAEPALLAAAAAEFDDTEAMMQASEKLFGPYRWGRYDLLILPPSFPFGGMENPRLSFITPTVIAGDKSLVALIAHELAHSWSGNLVTNATWNDLWLNEGFTVYLESRIMEVVYGPARRAMEDVLGYQSLLDDFADLDDGDEHLWLDLRDRDPDDSFTNVPYQKGRLLLVWLENAFGRDVFDRFLRAWFDEYGFRSVHTGIFLDYLETHLLAKHPGIVSREQVHAWVHRAGIPTDAVLPASNALTLVDGQRQAWLTGDRAAANLTTTQWTVHEWLYFLNNLPETLSGDQLAEIDAAFKLTASRNNEIAHSWLRIAIRNRYEPALPRLRDYLIGIGRRKLITPLYEDLALSEWGRAFAQDVYRQARPGYHPQAASALDKIVAQ